MTAPPCYRCHKPSEMDSQNGPVCMACWWEPGDDPTICMCCDPACYDCRFQEFHNANPRVYVELVKLARMLQGKGREHYGIGALFEVVRFHRAIQTTDALFKLNNNYRSRYARLIMGQEIDLDGFFETRELKT